MIFSNPFLCRVPIVYASLAIAATLGCGDAPPLSEQSAESAKPPAPAAILWVCVDPLDPASDAIEFLVARHNERFPDQPIAGRYTPPEEFGRLLSRIDQADLPPDLFLIPSGMALDLGRRGFLKPLDTLAPQAGVDLEGIYPAALRSARSENRLWGLPVCASMTFCYTNPNASGRSNDWGKFLAGEVGECLASSDRLDELLEKNPPFPWRTRLTTADGREIARETFQTLTLSVSSRGLRPLERAHGLLRESQEKEIVSKFGSTASKMPVRRFEKIDVFLRDIRLEDGWIDAWEEE